MSAGDGGALLPAARVRDDVVCDPVARVHRPAPGARSGADAGRRGAHVSVHALPAASIVVLGTGTVGRAVLQRLQTFGATTHGGRLVLHGVANTRGAWAGAQVSIAECLPPVAGVDAMSDPSMRPGAVWRLDAEAAGHADRLVAGLDPASVRIVIDATPSLAIARRHARWLGDGIHVVTACKLARGTSLRRWHAIEHARLRGGTLYGEAATVGAGLPLLSSLRTLRAGGERIHSVAGVLSGSLAWLLHAFDGSRPFSALVAEARAAGYTEPDPRVDLGGLDVRRKLLILARAAGAPLRERDVLLESLVPPALLHGARVPEDWRALDAPMAARLHAARARGRVLRFVARWEHGRARVGIEALEAGDALAQSRACDNRVAIHCDRYRAQPLVVQGPGAGAQVTAAALLDDVLAIVRNVAARGASPH